MIHLQFIYLVKSISDLRPPGVLGSGENGYLFSGSWGELVIIFQGFGEQVHSFGDLGSPAKK